MKSTETTLSRVFILRCEHGDRLPDVLEQFCKEKHINRAVCFFLGGIKDGSRLVQGPKTDSLPPEALVRILEGVHEVVGLGTVFPDETGMPSLHAHATAGRDGRAQAGCIRPGIETWHILEIILLELGGPGGERMRDPDLGFSLLNIRD